MGAEPCTWFDMVFINHAQMTEARVLWIVIVAKRKGVAAIEPAESRMAALISRSDLNHFVLVSIALGDLSLFSFTIHKTLMSSGLNREAEFVPLMEATS
jgi:hypothetical protein